MPPERMAEIRATVDASHSDADESTREDLAKKAAERFFEQYVLLDQPFIRDESVRVRDLIASVIGTLGENITVRRFARFELGG